MIELRLLVLCLAYMSHTVRALSGEQIAEDMRASLSAGSGVYLSSDHKYSEETTPRWDVYDAPLYTVAVKPVLTRDIQIIVSSNLFLQHEFYPVRIKYSRRRHSG